ncbi:MAG: aminodeoxychorismate lyase [Lachnospiraceae bacterium]|nr:aminodeoxychorismate lyase [Lachnospiraceae bacterium]MBR1913453.1 aminodeoxychorismate lyase [Lachnospiraceae bacterium]
MSAARIRSIIGGLLNFIIRACILLFIISMVKKVCLTAYDYGYRIYSEPPMAEGDGVDIVVDIPVGSSVLDTGKMLVEYGLIRDEKLFFMQERLSDFHGKLEPGMYTLNTSMTVEEMMAVMSPSISEDETGEDG